MQIEDIGRKDYFLKYGCSSECKVNTIDYHSNRFAFFSPTFSKILHGIIKQHTKHYPPAGAHLPILVRGQLGVRESLPY